MKEGGKEKERKMHVRFCHHSSKEATARPKIKSNFPKGECWSPCDYSLSYRLSKHLYFLDSPDRI